MDDQAKNYFSKLVGGEKNEEVSVEPVVDQSLADDAPIASVAKAETIAIKKPKTKKVKSELDFMEDDFVPEAEGQLTVDVYQTDEDIVIQSTIAGVEPEDLEVDITGESVSIKGKRHQSDTIKDHDYFYQECYWGRFSRSIILPQEINPDKAKASLDKGILTIRLPKLERERNKKLRVKVS